MRRSKVIYILLGVLAALCIGVFALTKIQDHKENIRNSGEVFLSIEPSDVTALSWNVEDSIYSFTKQEQWTYDADPSFPVDENKIQSLLNDFYDFGATFVIEDVEDSGQYGLTNPQGTVTITTASQTYTITLGDYSTIDAQRYVSVGDGKVYLVSYDPLEDFSVELSDLILDDTIPYFEKINSVSFNGDEDYKVTYQENSTDTACSEDVYFVGTKPLDTDMVTKYFNSLTYLSLDNYITYRGNEENLSAYYLENPDLTATVNYSSTNADDTVEEGSFTFSIGCNREELAKAKENGDTSQIAAFFRVGDSSIIYQISADDYETLMAYTYNDLRHANVISVDSKTIYQMDFTLEGKTYTLLRDEDAEAKSEEDVAIWQYNEETVVFADVNSGLTGLTYSAFNESATPGKQELSLTLYLHNDTFPQIKMTFYRYDGTDCVAKVDGKTVGLVPRSQVVDLIEAVNTIVLSIA